MPDPTQTARSEALKAIETSHQVQIHELAIDGVRCFWAPGHGAMTAGLMFGVGEADEGFTQRGFTRLIERLVVQQLGDDITAAAGNSETIFSMSGHRADVSQFFRSLLRTLRSLPYQDLDAHAGGLVTDSLTRTHPARAEAMSIAYGYAGPGVLGLPRTGLLQPDAQAIDQWRRQYFIKENVAAFFFGPRPQDISFSELSSGVRPDRKHAIDTLNPGPLEYRAEVAGPAVYAPIQSGQMTAMALDVARERLNAGLEYLPGIACSVEIEEFDAETSWLSIETRARQSQHQDVLDVMVAQLGRLVSEGPELDDVLRAVKERDEYHSNKSSETSLVEAMAQSRSAVRGVDHVSYALFRSKLATESRSAITAPLATALENPIWALPHDSPSRTTDTQPVPPWFRQVAGADNGTGALLASAIQGRQNEIVVHYEGISKPVTLTAENLSGVVVSNDGEVAFYHEAGLVFRSQPRSIDAEDVVRAFLLELPAGCLRKVGERLVVIPAELGGSEPSIDEEPAENGQGLDNIDDEQRLAQASEPDGEELSSAGLAGQAAAHDHAAGTEVEDDSSQETKPRRKRHLRLVKNSGEVDSGEGDARDAVPIEDLPAAVPDATATYSYPSAIQFAEALVAEAWPMAERLYDAASSSDEQNHFISVAGATGGPASRYDAWVEGSSSPGLSLTVRAANRMKTAWSIRDRQAGNSNKKTTQDFWTSLEAAEEDLVLATIEFADSPVPWVQLLRCARGLERPRRPVEQIYINHVERGALLAGHLEFQQYMTKKWFGSHDEMWDQVYYVSTSEPDGSPSFAVAAMAFIEEWVDQCQSGLTDDDDASGMLVASGRKSQLIEAAQRSYGHESFDLLSVSSAKALEIFFTYYWSIGDFVSAAKVSSKMGKRYSGHPMVYFTDEPWTVVKATARSAAKAAKVA